MVWLIFIDFHQELSLSNHGTNHQVDEQNIIFYLDHRVSISLGSNQAKVHGSTDFNISKLALEFHVHTNASLLVVNAMLAIKGVG